MSELRSTNKNQYFYRATSADFLKIPGSPIAYWVSQKWFNAFKNYKSIGAITFSSEGIKTGNNERFLRFWHEISNTSMGTLSDSTAKWVAHHKGGEYRKWYGNMEYVIDWLNNGEKIKNMSNSGIQGEKTFRVNSAIWSDVASGGFSARLKPKNHLFDSASPSAYITTDCTTDILSFLNSKITSCLVPVLNPTLHFKVGNFRSLPFEINIKNEPEKLIHIGKTDWDFYETSWDFTLLPLLAHDIKQPTISFNYAKLRKQWLTDTQEMQRLEEENNRIFIDAYGLQDELTPEVPLKEITLTCNPHYRYGGDLTDQEREERLQSDTIAELLSYAIGCMMGRYSLDREGLVYAHAGNEGFADLVAEGAYKTFAADDDAILPLTEQEWFSDDVTNRISEFVHTVWGEQHLEENLQFIADSLCLYALKAKKGERALDTIRRYLSNQFYKDHLKTYKRRPIYWLFSSGKHKAFECLVYLHRYHEGTLARMRTEYVIPLSSRINARINRLQEEAEAASSTSERKQLMAELKTLQNQQAELSSFDEQLRHHADMRITLDLDDGVKENYGKFGNLLDSVKAVTGKNND